MSSHCRECGAAAGWGHELGHSVNCSQRQGLRVQKAKPIAWVVEPCEQWHKENPGKPKYIFWESERFAKESADDTGGKVIPLYEFFGPK